jgi:pimeloyl-ACP methyl ester carboxylesterase
MTDSTPATPAVVLVHGAWADASSWRRVIPILLAKGLKVVAVQNPTTSLAADVAVVRQAIDLVDGPVVLVGHSWGGTVITEAGNAPNVKALVYVAAFAPDVGQSTGDQVQAHDAPPGLSTAAPYGDGFLKMSAEGWINNVAQDLPDDEARVLATVQPPLAVTTFGDKVSTAAWKTCPSWYVVSLKDRAVNVALQREVAARMKAKTTELDSSHVSLLSQPAAVAEVILDAVAAVQF